jgi:hypothetical protein
VSYWALFGNGDVPSGHGTHVVCFSFEISEKKKKLEIWFEVDTHTHTQSGSVAGWSYDTNILNQFHSGAAIGAKIAFVDLSDVNADVIQKRQKENQSTMELGFNILL